MILTGLNDGRGVLVYLPFWNVEDGLELKLAFDGEVLNGKMLLPVVGQAFVEGTVLFLGDVLRVPRPNRLGLVKLLVFDSDFLDLLLLLWFVFVFIVDLLDLGFLFLILFDLFFYLFFVIFNFLKERLA